MQSDINSESDQPTPMGRGMRSRRLPSRYLPSEMELDEQSSIDESVGMYGPTQHQTFNPPAIPQGLASNAVNPPVIPRGLLASNAVNPPALPHGTVSNAVNTPANR